MCILKKFGLWKISYESHKYIITVIVAGFIIEISEKEFSYKKNSLRKDNCVKSSKHLNTSVDEYILLISLLLIYNHLKC